MSYLKNKFMTPMNQNQMDDLDKNLDFTEVFQLTPSANSQIGQAPQSASLGQTVAQNAPATAAQGAAAAALGGPAVAGITVGGQILSNYLSQKAQDERAKRERAAQIEANYGQDQQNAFNQIMNNYARALR